MSNWFGFGHSISTLMEWSLDLRLTAESTQLRSSDDKPCAQHEEAMEESEGT
ncbi:hypothetical protein YC2023_061749 [Brassica napus]